MLEKYYSINQATGINIHIRNDGTISMDACGVAVKGDQLDIETKVTDLTAMEDLIKHFPAKSLIAINITGKGILQKQVESIDEVDQNSFSKVMPNANRDDFYVQHFASGGQSFISVIRKTEADKWIGQIKEQGFIPLILSLGPFPLQHIIPQLNVYGNEIIFNGNIIQRDEQAQWVGYKYDGAALSPFPLKLESEPINEKLVLPYAAAFQLVLSSKLDAIRADVISLETALEEKLATSKLKVKAALALGVLFILLLVNFILFSWLGSSNTQLASQVSRTAQNTNDIQGINDKIKQKEGLLQNLGWEAGINKSALIDQIAALLPPDITWREVAINPVDISSSRIQKSLVFFSRKIKVAGNSQNILPVNEWMARVKTKVWVKNIQLESYTYNNELNTGQFTILIDY